MKSVKRAKRTRRVSSAGGLKVKALTQNVRDMGSSPAQCYTFCLYLIHSKRIIIYNSSSGSFDLMLGELDRYQNSI